MTEDQINQINLGTTCGLLLLSIALVLILRPPKP